MELSTDSEKQPLIEAQLVPCAWYVIGLFLSQNKCFYWYYWLIIYQGRKWFSLLSGWVLQRRNTRTQSWVKMSPAVWTLCGSVTASVRRLTPHLWPKVTPDVWPGGNSTWPALSASCSWPGRWSVSLPPPHTYLIFGINATKFLFFRGSLTVICFCCKWCSVVFWLFTWRETHFSYETEMRHYMTISTWGEMTKRTIKMSQIWPGAR